MNKQNNINSLEALKEHLHRLLLIASTTPTSLTNGEVLKKVDESVDIFVKQSLEPFITTHEQQAVEAVLKRFEQLDDFGAVSGIQYLVEQIREENPSA